MRPDDLRALLDYHYWARDRVLDAAAALSPDQYIRDLGNSFRSVRDTLVHTYSAEWIWYSRWQGESPAGMLDAARFPDVGTLRQAWQDHEQKMRTLFAGLGADGISKVVEYKSMAGQPMRSVLWHMLQHVVNHGTYHRGQVTTLLRQLGATPPKSMDLIAYIASWAPRLAREDCMMVRQRILPSLMVLGALLMSNATPRAQSDQEAANQFWGVWRMVSRTQRLADGTTRPYPNNVGYIVYTEPGYMCYAAMNPNRPLWKSASPTPEEAQAAITGLNAYCASVEVHAKEGFILHHVEIERVPNDVGKIRKRWFTFQGPNRVVFRIDSTELSPPVVEDTLVWERVQKR